MKPPPRSLEEWLYRYLMESPRFHHYVRRVHAKINRIPMHEEVHKTMEARDYKPTRAHKFNAFRIIWFDELKRSFGFGKR